MGNTLLRKVNLIHGAVHPHARGEHCRQPMFTIWGSGSSPRPWGTRFDHRITLSLVRFIPTPVGNTGPSPSMITVSSVHPHARGEHGQAYIRLKTEDGSSPRPWGTHLTQIRQRSRCRFIPTPVGNTTAERQECSADTVHPHARGEHRLNVAAAPINCGSSPRPWGTPRRSCGTCYWHRFIPTPVGNTCMSCCTVSTPTVHPHARGEHA